MAEHISSQFNSELESVRTLVMQMGGLVEKQLTDTLSALLSMNAADLKPVIESDSEINAMEVQIDDECQLIIARRQPAAGDLRLVLTVTRIIVDLERIGDEIKKAALTAYELMDHDRVVASDFYEFNRMCNQTNVMLRTALDAFARIDTDALLNLVQADRQVDYDYRNQTRSLITYMMEDPRTISTSIDLMFMSKAVERIGDHAVNIAEHVVYLAKGIDVRHSPLETVKAVLDQS
ncbi:phosphate signaling complex protein PhoU [Snodgrassella sp. CFCC 13594]|uniref:phosphate signaling complex protein PhoU n=1 Tax=Snodgrassella sp. CFCC 13594 TaxID=1775559 RepID=UPI00082D59BB|nr:phosphate signaling complex protein PhoU [Snodgrassella sp. CFCC 13594]